MKSRSSAILGWFLSGLCWMALSPTLSFAQSRTAVGIGESFTVAATPPTDGQPTALRFFVDGAQVGADVPLQPSGDTSATLPGLTQAGRHRLEVAAVNGAGPGPRSGIDFWVGPPPAPSLPRIQVTTTQVFDQVPRESGGLELKLVSTSTAYAEVK
jgi:hypothetical protein